MQPARKTNPVTPPRPALSIVPRTQRAPRSPLALWHLLSLDAPSVASVWTVAIASAVGLHLPWTSPAAMFLAVWILYVADRLLDARSLDSQQPAPDLEARHVFHHRHRRAFLIGIILSACALTALLRTLDMHALRIYVLLATLLAGYFLVIHARADSAHRLPKELAVGIFFAAAVFIPTVARLPLPGSPASLLAGVELRLDLLPIALLLAATCSLNCLFLYAWEHPGPPTHAHWSTRWATRHLVALTWTVAALSLLALFCLLSTRLSGTYALTACILTSSLLLLTLHHLRRRLQPIHLRALADLVLLTPLIPLALSLIPR
ncbi:MAG TPA: hypothetical protein VFA99_10765 [Acidobacteriaceae bacterium]|nr:hypothetical protein [Acidobacteriaceae bacterium]